MARSLRNQRRKTAPNTSSTGSKVRQKFTIPKDDDDLFPTLQDFLRQTWTIFSVTALFNLKQNETYFKKYAKRLREEVALGLSQENVAYDAKFFIPDEAAARPSPMDPPSVKIEIYSTTINEEEEEIEKCIYKGVLLSWNTEHSEDIGKHSIRMPLLLCRGTKGAIDIVHTTLGKLFDCMVIPLPATSEDLMWLIPILITYEKAKASDEVKAEYAVPGLPLSNNFTWRFKVQDLTSVLEVIKEDQQEEDLIELRHVERFHAILHTQMLEIAGVELGLCTLRRITLPSITIMENRMKITRAETMNAVLFYLNEKALNLCHRL